MAKYNIASIETLEKVSGKFSDSFKSSITDALELKTMRGRFWFVPPPARIFLHLINMEFMKRYIIK